MKMPKLKVVGVCSGKCGQEVAAGPSNSSAGPHPFKGKPCSGIGYSFRSTRLVVETDQEATEVATFLVNNKWACFDQPWEGGRHSMACGDGERCHELRAKHGHALAIYWLDRSNQLSESEGAEGSDTVTL